MFQSCDNYDPTSSDVNKTGEMTTYTITYQAADPKRESNEGHEPEEITVPLCHFCLLETGLMFSDPYRRHSFYEFDEHCGVCGDKIPASKKELRAATDV